MGCVQSVSSVPITGHADVIFVGDNSASMGTALEHFETHLEPFVALLDARGIDVRIILLSLRARGLVTINNSQRYGLCIPPPLAGDDECGDGTRFFQRSVDVLSTAVLEQVLGTLGQTAGYTATDPRGGPEWASLLRPRSAPSFVIISDDNARLNADNFETFAGGQNPFNGLTLPPGVLDPSWGGRFTGYGVSGVYGWGSETDPTARCTFANNTSAASSGPTYTDLVARTGGVRARICDEAAGWDTFIEALATDIGTKRAPCDVALPATLDPSLVNLRVGSTLLAGVADASSCGTHNAWYYDDPSAPTAIRLCPAACTLARAASVTSFEVEVEQGCPTLPPQ
jgi:hypothetical protein